MRDHVPVWGGDDVTLPGVQRGPVWATICFFISVTGEEHTTQNNRKVGLNPAQSILLLLFTAISLETNETGLHPLLKYVLYVCHWLFNWLSNAIWYYVPQTLTSLMILIKISQPVHITCLVVAPHLDHPSVLTGDDDWWSNATLNIRLPKNKSIKSWFSCWY